MEAFGYRFFYIGEISVIRNRVKLNNFTFYYFYLISALPAFILETLKFPVIDVSSRVFGGFYGRTNASGLYVSLHG